MYSVKYIDDHLIERMALSHRRKLGFRDDQAVDMMTLITKLKDRYREFDYIRVPDGTLGEAEAQWNSDTKRLIIPESVFSGANGGNSRDRMTVMHEVAHALLGHKGKLNRAPVGNRTERLSESVRRAEWQAKRYAAAFLVPALPAVVKMTVNEIVMNYWVSHRSASYRISEINRFLRG